MLGLAVAFVPGLPDLFDLEPDLILPLFLPPLLFATAQRTSWALFRARWRTIAFLAVALVAATVTAVAGTAAALVPGLIVTAAIALGAMVAPPDPVAVEAVAGPVRMPRRLLTVLQSEGLFNDATRAGDLPGRGARHRAGLGVQRARACCCGSSSARWAPSRSGLGVALVARWVTAPGHRHDGPQRADARAAVRGLPRRGGGRTPPAWWRWWSWRCRCARPATPTRPRSGSCSARSGMSSRCWSPVSRSG